MEAISESQYTKIVEAAKNGNMYADGFYTEKILVASMDEIATHFHEQNYPIMALSVFYEMMKILLFGNKSITCAEYNKELENIEKEVPLLEGDEIIEYLIKVLIKYIK